MKSILSILLAIAFVFSVPALAQQHQNAAGHDHNTKFSKSDLDVEMWLGRLENPDRDVIKHRETVIDALQLKSGQYVADVGAGTGAYMMGISKAVGPTGRYIGVDIAPDFHGFMRKRSEEAGLDNVTLVVSRMNSATLPPASVDVIVSVDTYHHFSPYEPMLSSMFSALKPGGTLLIIDWNNTPDARDWIKENVRADKETFKKEIEASGFTFIEEITDSGLEENFFFRFRRPE